MITFGYKSKSGGFIRGAAALALGAVMLFTGNAVDLIVYIIATFILLSGLLYLWAGLKRDGASQRPLVIINSGFNVAIAMLMYIFANELGNFVISIIGFLMLIFSFVQLLVIGSVSRGGLMSKGYFAMPIVVLACGILLLVKPDFIGRFIGVVLGVSFILFGVSELISSWKLRSVISQVEPQTPQPEDEQKPAGDIKDVDYEKVDEQ